MDMEKSHKLKGKDYKVCPPHLPWIILYLYVCGQKILVSDRGDGAMGGGGDGRGDAHREPRHPGHVGRDHGKPGEHNGVRYSDQFY